jgi:DNA-binding GntR family transcriptional regulator
MAIPGPAKGPLYATLAQHLSDAIADGTYAVGSLLPTEHELSELYGVSRQTVREALRQMTQRGQLERQRGIGTRVLREHGPVRYTDSVNSFAELERYTTDLRLVLDHVEDVVATGALARFIGCRQGTSWLYLRGLRYAAGSDEPIAFSETYVRNDYPGLREHLARLRGPVYGVLEREYGETIVEVQQQVFAVSLANEMAGALHVEAGSPGLEIRRRFFNAGGRLVISGHVVHAGSRFNYASRFIREGREG